MPLSLQSPEDIANGALVRVGWKGPRIGSLYEGSETSKKILDIYGQTRDELLRSADWGFAERDVTLTLLKMAPPGGYVYPTAAWSSTYPILPWRYEYAYPADALKVRSIRRTAIFLPDYDPKPNVWRVANDASLTPPAQVILCNVAGAILVYTGQVTDPSTWEPGFAETLCAALSRRLGPALVNLDAAKVEAGDEVATRQMAEMKEG